MATGRHRIAGGQVIVVTPTKTTTFNPGDSIPPLIELYDETKGRKGGAVFDGTDVPVEYLFYYLDEANNVHAFLRDFPSVRREQVLAVMEERLQANIDSVINSDRNYVSGTPRFNETRMPVHILFEYLADGYTIEGFLENYDTSVTTERSAEVLRVARQLVEFYAYKAAFQCMDAGQ